MLLVGLTGGIASGKSTVSAMLAERGAEIIDADHIARQIVLPGLPAWCKIREHFGPGVLHPDGQIDRQALADIVFADKAKLALLNEITHPAIFARIADRLEEYHDQDVVVILDAALLIEAGLAEGVDVVIVTHSPTEIQVERLAAKGVGERDASSPDRGPAGAGETPGQGGHRDRQQRLGGEAGPPRRRGLGRAPASARAARAASGRRPGPVTAAGWGL